MVYEVVIVRNHRSFSLSKAAVERLMELLPKSFTKDMDLDYGGLKFLLEEKLDRHDPALVQTIKQLEGQAHGDADSYAGCDENPFVIAEVHDRYRICEYDGSEWIEQPEDLKWMHASVGNRQDLPCELWRPGSEQYVRHVEREKQRSEERKRKRDLTEREKADAYLDALGKQ